MVAPGFCQRWLCIPGMQSDSWLPFGYQSYKKAFPVAKTIQHTQCRKVLEYQQVSAFINTSENAKSTTRNEKVACSSQVTSSKKPTVFTEETVAFCIVWGGVKGPVCGLDVPGIGINCNLAGRIAAPLGSPFGRAVSRTG